MSAIGKRRFAHAQSLAVPAGIAGYSLITTMIALFVFTLSTSATMQLVTLNIQSEAQTYSDEVSTDIRTSIELMQDITLGAGAGTDAELAGPQASVKLCSIESSETGYICNSFNGANSDSLCFAATAHNLPNEPEGLQARGIRLVQGQLQYKLLKSLSKGWSSHRSFCEDSTGWINLNAGNRYQVESLKVCNLDSSSADSANINFSSSCASVLDNTSSKNRGWMIEILASESAGDKRPHRYFAVLSFQNPTRVETL